jgi:hypothetical protein
LTVKAYTTLPARSVRSATRVDRRTGGSIRLRTGSAALATFSSEK